MAITEVAKGGLLLPDGSVLDVRPRDVIPVVSPLERQTLARFHEVAQKYGLAVICLRCDHALQGHNNDTSPTLSVACRCREWRFVR